MKYAVKDSNNNYNGVIYDTLEQKYIDHHKQYSEILVPVESLTYIIDIPKQLSTGNRKRVIVREVGHYEAIIGKITSVTALQGMLAISAFGLIEQFNTWKASLDPVLDFDVIAYIDKAQHWEYDSPVLNAALLLLGIEEHKDTLFELASTL